MNVGQLDSHIDYTTAFNNGTQGEVDELVKALGTGQGGEAYGNGAYGDMSALRPQSLEETLKKVTASSEHVRLWKTLSKKTAFNTSEEYNIMDRMGGDASPFFVEGGLPNEQDSSYVRKSALVKFLGTTRVVTHPATLVRTAGVGDIVAQEAQNGTEWLIMQIERQLFYADSNLNPLAFDGILAQMKNFLSAPYYKGGNGTTPTGQSAEQFIDLRGGYLPPEALEDGANIIFENFGVARQLQMTPGVRKDISKLYMSNFSNQRTERTMTGDEVGAIGRGELETYRSNAGTFTLEPNLFLRPRGAYKAVSDNGAPAAPTTTGITQSAPASDSVSLFSTTDGGKYGNATFDSTGSYYYFVAAKNAIGESVPVAIATNGAGTALAFAVGNGQAATIQWNRVVGSPAAQSYCIYRGKKQDGSDALFMDEVKDAGSGTIQSYVDRNYRIPGTHDAFLIDTDPNKSMTFKQLAPLMKLPLARISAAERFMILLYGMPIVYNPRTQVYYFNIGVMGGTVNRDLFDANFRPSYGTVAPVTGTNTN
jgi:hypothetical protein